MRISAVNSNYATNKLRNSKETTSVQNPIETNSKSPANLAFISFKSGNKSQVVMIGVEVPPYNKSGGVATVMQDFRALRINESDPQVTNEIKNSFDFYKQANKVLVDPFNNGHKVYQSNGFIKEIKVPTIPEGLPEDSPFKKYEGRYFQTTNNQFQNYNEIKDFFAKEKNLSVAQISNSGVKGNVFILDKISDKKPLDFGALTESTTGLYRVNLEVNGELKKTNDFKVFTDLTAGLKTPYERGGYSTTPGRVNQTWKGEADAKVMKAIIEYLPEICEETSKDGIKFDPATVILNDSQAGYATEYMARESVKGGEFWKGKKAIFIGHNLGDGYVQRTSYQNMFVNLADKELRNAVYYCDAFTEAAKEGQTEVDKFFKSILPEECFDVQKQVSPFRNSIYWADKGLVTKIIPVSEMYANAIATDPEFIPSVHRYIKELEEKGRFGGILNAFENVEFNPTSAQGPKGYYGKDFDINVNNENVKIEKLSVFDAEKIKEGAVDTAHIREIKRQNKFKILQRFDKDVLEALKNDSNEKLINEVVLGLEDKKATVHGYIKKEIIEEAAKANSKVRMISGWGRIDVQKALDTAMLAFVDYLKNNPNDKYSVLFIGGPNNTDSKGCIDIIKKFARDPEVAGRMVFIDGFLPNKPFAAASDFTVFPSRFAPCELTDLESIKMFASPIVTNLQGLAQKNFDATFEGEAEKATAYKTKHAYTIHLDELKKCLSSDDADDLDKAVKEFYAEVKKSLHGSEITEQMIKDEILTDAALNWKYNFEVLRPFRDKLIQTELTGLYQRALIEDNGKPIQDQMLQNISKLKTEWENNGALKPDGKSSAQKYREALQADPEIIKEEDTLLSKLRENCKDILENARKGQAKNETGSKSNFSKTKAGKITIGISGAISLVALGFALIKSSKAKCSRENELNASQFETFDNDSKTKNLSALV
ncbi:hypothetical protein J6R97_08470 [bacterium]|nr:hypothetical protein [bacterium]